MTSKQRAYLKGLASTMDSILQVGKGSINDQMIKQVNDALEARELIKGNVLQNSDYEVREIAEELAEKTNSEVVHTIGKRFVLYRESKKNKTIILPK